RGRAAIINVLPIYRMRLSRQKFISVGQANKKKLRLLCRRTGTAATLGLALESDRSIRAFGGIPAYDKYHMVQLAAKSEKARGRQRRFASKGECIRLRGRSGARVVLPKGPATTRRLPLDAALSPAVSYTSSGTRDGAEVRRRRAQSRRGRWRS